MTDLEHIKKMYDEMDIRYEEIDADVIELRVKSAVGNSNFYNSLYFLRTIGRLDSVGVTEREDDD